MVRSLVQHQSANSVLIAAIRLRNVLSESGFATGDNDDRLLPCRLALHNSSDDRVSDMHGIPRDNPVAARNDDRIKILCSRRWQSGSSDCLASEKAFGNSLKYMTRLNAVAREINLDSLTQKLLIEFLVGAGTSG